MLFDKLAGFAEKHMPGIVQLMEEAYIFDFPGIAHEVLAKRIPPEDLEAFFLPHKVIAVEDKASAVIAIDTEDEQIGLDGKRKFIEIINSNSDPSNFAVHHPDTDAIQQQLGGQEMYMITFGEITQVKAAETRYYSEGSVSQAFLYDGKDIQFHVTGSQIQSSPEGREMFQGTIGNYLTCLEQVHHFNRPASFVVEAAPVKGRKTAKGRVTRSHDRPHYTILDVSEIHSRFGLGGTDSVLTETGRKKPTPHARRRHWRTLRSERYGENKGKQIIIPASWIGPTECQIGKKYYKVRLDL